MSALVWWQAGRIVTRNSDGGTTGWSIIDALELHRVLGDILNHVGSEDAAEGEFSQPRKFTFDPDVFEQSIKAFQP